MAYVWSSKQNILHGGGKRRFVLEAERRQQPTQTLNTRLRIHIKHTHDAAYQYRNGTNQSAFQKCFTYVLMLHDLQSLCKWAAAPCNGFCSSWEAGVSEKLLIEGEMQYRCKADLIGVLHEGYAFYRWYTYSYIFIKAYKICQVVVFSSRPACRDQHISARVPLILAGMLAIMLN